MHSEITGGKEELHLIYRPFFSPDAMTAQEWWQHPQQVEEAFHQEIQRVRKDEVYRGVTLVGPQRDDLAFYIGSTDLRFFGSQGQQRTAVLSCKLAEIEFMKEEADEYPILLLDDVMSELDDQRRSYFLKTVTGRINTFITTTNLRSFTSDILEQASIYTIQRGSVQTA